MKSFVFTIPFLVSTFVFSAEQNWPEWRGAGGQGVASAREVPVEWSETKSVVIASDLGQRSLDDNGRGEGCDARGGRAAAEG